MKRLGLKLDMWVPYLLTKRNLCLRVDVCDLLLERQFLKHIINEDKKWVVYDNTKRRRKCSKKDEPERLRKPILKKMMLSVWRDFKGIVFLELLPDDATINSEVYC